MAEHAQRNLQLYRELISCSHNIYFWTFDTRQECVFSTCPQENILKLIFAMDKANTDAAQVMLGNRKPMVITSSLGFLWIADIELGTDGSLLYTHVIGPVFVEDVSFQSIEGQIGKTSMPLEFKADIMNLLRELPVIPLTRFLEYGSMLHFCIIEEKLNISEFNYSSHQKKQSKDLSESKRLHGTWAMEQKLLKLIEEGNLDYRKQAGRLVTNGRVGNLGNGDSLRHLKNLVIVFTALCTRAAIRGGLDSEIAYTLSDQYIRAAEACEDIASVTEVNTAMQDDFVHRVHHVRSHSDLSPQILSCCSYIQVHVTERISTAELAKHVGYAETYLCRKFSKEMGMTISEYILSQKVEYAKIMLASSTETVQEIAEKLGFQSNSYFGEQFRKVTGLPPGAYRNRNRQ